MVGGLTALSSNPRIRAAENLAAFEDDFSPPAKPVGFYLNIGAFAAALPSFLLFHRRFDINCARFFKGVWLHASFLVCFLGNAGALAWAFLLRQGIVFSPLRAHCSHPP